MVLLPWRVGNIYNNRMHTSLSRRMRRDMHARWELPPGRGRAPVEKEHGVPCEEPKDILRVRVRTYNELYMDYRLRSWQC